MAANIQVIPAKLADYLLEDTSVNGTVVYGVSGAATMYQVRINNTSGAAVFLKFWDATSGVTVGTTDPVIVLKCPASSARTYNCLEGMHALGTGMAYACVTAGGTAGTTNPAATVDIRVQYD